MRLPKVTAFEFIKGEYNLGFIILPKITAIRRQGQYFTKSEADRIVKLVNGVSEGAIVISKKVIKDDLIRVIFDRWNEYKGRNIIKPDRFVVWKAHPKITADIEYSAREALRKFSVDDIIQAIDNYASILLSKKCQWSYAWTLAQFLTRSRPDNRQEKQLWRFIPNNFVRWDYLTEAAKEKAVKERRGKNNKGKEKEKMRQEYTKYILEADEKTLKKIWEAWPFIRWLITELRGYNG